VDPKANPVTPAPSVPSRTHWNRALTALERAGSGVSWRSSWRAAAGRDHRRGGHPRRGGERRHRVAGRVPAVRRVQAVRLVPRDGPRGPRGLHRSQGGDDATVSDPEAGAGLSPAPAFVSCPRTLAGCRPRNLSAQVSDSLAGDISLPHVSVLRIGFSRTHRIRASCVVDATSLWLAHANGQNRWPYKHCRCPGESDAGFVGVA
jgi:hypothetical protein